MIFPRPSVVFSTLLITGGCLAGETVAATAHTPDPAFCVAAIEAAEVQLDGQKNNTRTHDVGFIMFNSYGNGLRLTANEAYEPVLLQTAESLMTRYNPRL